MTPEWRNSLFRKWREMAPRAGKQPLLPGLPEFRLRSGWEMGFERGFMQELQEIFARNGGQDLESDLLGLLTEVQTDIDRACDALERDKLRLTRERVTRILE